MESRTIKSTSKRSASTDDLILRETGTTRLVFRPILVVNEKNEEASVKGTFIFQRKGVAEQWEDSESIPLSTLKKGEGVQLEIKSGELLKLYSELTALYDLYRKEGIPRGEARFIKASRTVQAVAEMTDEELTAVVKGTQSLGAEALARLIRWASEADNFSLMFDRLKGLQADSLLNLNAALGISVLTRALKAWSDNRNNPDEEYWQQLLQDQSFVLEQVFFLPVVIIKSKAYVGGKSILNTGGKVVDFLVKNSVTKSVGLVEIKTPKTPLLGKQYRGGIYNISDELSGAILQVLSYRESLSRDRVALLGHGSLDADTFDPKCLVIIGHAKRELTDTEKRRSFELFRAQLPDVEVITYDEMFERTRSLVNLLEGRVKVS